MIPILSDLAATVTGVTNQLHDIRTERLVLRRMVEGDRAAVVALQAMPETHEHSSRPPSTEEADALFTTWLAHWADHGFGYWAMVEAESGALVGLGGLRNHELRGERVLNLAYRLLPGAWGRGYAPEMAAAAVDWAEREVPGRPVVIVTSTTNEAARRVADKLGFHQYHEGDYDGVPSAYYRRR